MALSYSFVKRGVMGDLRYVIADVTFDSSYAVDGESLTPADLRLHEDIYSIQFEQTDGYLLQYDHSGSLVKVESARGTGVFDEASATGVVDDDDNAATAGVAVYCVIDEQDWIPGFALGHFEFVSPTNANATVTTSNGGPTLVIVDDDAAATNGTAVRIVAAGGGWESTFTGTQDPVLVPVSNGKYIYVVDATTGSTPEVYVDEDAANSYERLKAVVVDNGNETFTFKQVLPGAVAAGTDLSGLTVRVFAVGK